MLISNFFQLEIELNHFDDVSVVETNKKCNLSDHLFFYRLWHIRSFIHSSLDIVYDLRLDASKNRLDAPIFSYMILIIYRKCGKSFIEIIPLPASYPMRIP